MRKRTKSQILAARRNGAQSRGPLSQEGKAVVARNAVQHGLTAKVNILTTEQRPAFQRLLDSFLQHFSPQTDPEFLAVEEMATTKWKIRRAWALETARLDLQMDQDSAALDEKFENPSHAVRTTLAWSAARHEIQSFHRYTAELHRQHDRAYRLFLSLRAERLEDEAVEITEPESWQQLPEKRNKPEVPHVDLP